MGSTNGDLFVDRLTAGLPESDLGDREPAVPGRDRQTATDTSTSTVAYPPAAGAAIP
jgi:hypothetical protein